MMRKLIFILLIAYAPKLSAQISVKDSSIAFGSFGLGRLSKIEDNREPVTVENLAVDLPTNNVALASQGAPQVVPENGKYVASKNGTKYYLPWCTGVSKINEANKVWFQSKEEAVSAGYTPAANCTGI